MSKQRDQKIALKAIIVRDSKVLVLHRSKCERLHSAKWEIPGGRIKWGEEPTAALKREIFEETTLEVQVLKPVSVWQCKASKNLQIVGITFKALYLYGEVVLGTEHDHFRWIEPREARLFDMEVGIQADILEFGRHRLTRLDKDFS